MNLYVISWRFEDCGTVHSSLALTQPTAELLFDELIEQGCVDVTRRPATKEEASDWWRAVERIA